MKSVAANSISLPRFLRDFLREEGDRDVNFPAEANGDRQRASLFEVVDEE